MPLVTLVCVGLLGMADGSTPSPDVATAYQQAKAEAGRAPGDQVRLALWCEAHGLTAERARHLTLAILADPTNTVARGLAGLVARDGRWVAPDRVAESVQTDATAQALLAEYDQRRSKTAYTADAQWLLALWADEQGLTDQARAHFTAVTRLEPSRDLAWKRLGYRKQDGRWITDAQLAAAKAEADAQKVADRTWKTQLEKWRGMLAQPSRQAEAQAGLLGVTDPRAVPSIIRVFGTDRASDQRVAVGLLGQITAPQASRALAALAVFSPAADVRRVAVETLRQRDPRDFVGLWISLIRKPIEYEVQPVGGPGSPGGLFVHGSQANTQRVYRPMAMPNLAQFGDLSQATSTVDQNGLSLLSVDLGTRADFSTQIQGSLGAMMLGYNLNGERGGFDLSPLAQVAQQVPDKQLARELEKASKLSSAPERLGVSTDRGGRVPFDPNQTYEGVFNRRFDIPIGQMVVDARQSTEVARVQLATDVARLEKYNQSIEQANEPVLLAMKSVTAQSFGDDTTQWNRWWTDQQGYAFRDSSTTNTPTLVEEVPLNFTPLALPGVTQQLVGLNFSCFGAGTPVRTIEGTRPIELIRRGDLVLVQDTIQGTLSYQPVLTAFHNPPSATYRVKLGDEAIVATGIHRFWKAGQGWVMARDLQVGDSLRVLGGVATVDAVEPNQTEPVFNLEVAAGGSFFVGQAGVLVHDNSLVEATPNPFDSADLVIAKEKTSR